MNLALAHWLTTLKLWKGYFSYSVEGLEHLMSHDCHIVVGYHGRPLAYDLFLLGGEIHRELGYLPLALVHRGFSSNPYLHWLTRGLEWATGKGPELDDAIARGRHVILAPGGDREGLRPGWVRYRVDWGDHLGYLRLAISRGCPVVPVAASGVDDAYFGLLDGHRLARRRGVDGSLPLWVGLGPLGPWPFSPPFPVRIHQVIGEPIRPDEWADVDAGDRPALEALHLRIQARVQALSRQARRHVQSSRTRRLRDVLLMPLPGR
jgi:1-acyl-sn-glycerol-3-phosphate acyltransferase